MHRFALVFVFAALLLGAAVPARAAHAEGAGAVDPRLAGFPEFLVRLTEERIEAPARFGAGRALVVQENLEAEPGHAFILRVPDDVPEDRIAAALAPGSASAAQETPEWFWRSIMVGTPDRAAPNGGKAYGVVDLVPGRYLVGNPFRPPSEFARVEVVASAAGQAPVADPAADVAADMREMAFDMPTSVPAGRQVWKVTNVGAMFHEIALIPVPAGATKEQVEAAMGALMAAEMSGTPAAGDPLAALGPAWAGWTPDMVAGVGVTSTARSVWGQLDLAPGTYAAVCFVPDPATMTPHLMMGMTAVFTAGAPAA